MYRSLVIAVALVVSGETLVPPVSSGVEQLVRAASATSVALVVGGETSEHTVNSGVKKLVMAASDTCDALPLNLLYGWPSIPELEVMEYSAEGKRSYKLSKAHVLLRRRLPHVLIVYIPGWWNTPTDESSQTLVKALLQKHSLILVLDTREAFCRGYVGSASRVQGVAEKMFKFLNSIQSDGYPLSSVHLIGFSLGAHVSGITGKLVQSRLSRKIGRITALDPARPCFTKLSKYRLDKHDAKFVQVIHTSVGVLGLENQLGHTDVYVNGVSAPQPECRERAVSLTCDHSQSWKLFSASVSNERMLMGRKCKNWIELSNGQCGGNETMVGYSCNSKIRGMYLHRSQEENRQIWMFNPFDFRTWL